MSAPHPITADLPAADARYAASLALRERAATRLAGGISTAFRLYEQPVPLFVREARGARLVDVDGNRYVDYSCGFGPVILGHADERVADAVARAAHGVQQVGAQHEAEGELAELLCETVPAFEVVRYSMTGSEAVHAALRTARAATGRTKVLKFSGHYHGWFDEVFAARGDAAGHAQPDSAGQPASALQQLLVCDWNDRAAIDRVFAEHAGEIAAVIMEAVSCNQGVFEAAPGYLEHVRELTREDGALLVFDEVITGFRLGLGGAQARTGVTPDLAVVAKAMANGFPISAFGGSAELMAPVATNQVVHAGTFNGGGISVAAALATIGALQEGGPELYARMERLGTRLAEGLRDAGERHGHRLVVRGPGPVFFAWMADAGDVVDYAEHQRTDHARYQRFVRLLLDEGVRAIGAGRWYLTAAHDDEAVDETLAAAERAFARLER